MCFFLCFFLADCMNFFPPRHIYLCLLYNFSILFPDMVNLCQNVNNIRMFLVKKKSFVEIRLNLLKAFTTSPIKIFLPSDQ